MNKTLLSTLFILFTATAIKDSQSSPFGSPLDGGLKPFPSLEILDKAL